jgi:hypothetical protein
VIIPIKNPATALATSSVKPVPCATSEVRESGITAPARTNGRTVRSQRSHGRPNPSERDWNGSSLRSAERRVTSPKTGRGQDNRRGYRQLNDLELPSQTAVRSTRNVGLLSVPAGQMPCVRWPAATTAVFLTLTVAGCGSSPPKPQVAKAVPSAPSPSPTSSSDSAAGQRIALARASRDALSAARSDGAILLSYDYRQLDADFAEQAAVVTPGLLPTLKQAWASLRGPALANHVTLNAEVAKAAVTASSLTSVQVTAQIDQLLHNDLLPAPGNKVSTVGLTMTLVGST